MATIYNLVTQLTADPAPMKAGFDRGIALINSFASSAANVLSKPVRNATTGQYAKFGVDAANAVVNNLQSTFEAQQTKLKEAFARGALSAKQFEDLGVADAKAFNRTLLTSLDTLDASKVVPPEARAALVNALKDTGTAAAAAFDPVTAIGSKLRSFGRDLTQIGRELSLALTAPLVIGAVAAIKASDDFEHAISSIRVATGKTGDDLKSLETSFASLFKTLPDSAGDIAKALSAISVSSGATGPQLEALATQALQLARITGTDLTTNVTASQRAFQAWGIAVGGQADGLNTLFKVSQLTGQSVSDLATTVAHFAPTMKQFGLTFTQSAALIGQFQKSGIDADAIFTSLTTSLARFAENGIDGAHAFQLLITKIQEASTDAQGIDLASRVLGPREASQFALAVRSGQANIDALTASVRASSQTIGDAAKTFSPFDDALKVLKTAAEAAIEPIGNGLKNAFIAFQPTLIAIIGAVTATADAFSNLPRPLQELVIGALAALAALGPLALILGGIAKGTGAAILAFGLLKQAITGLGFSALGTEAATAATGLGAAAGASTTLVASLTLLGAAATAAGVIVGLTLIFEHFTKSASDAAKVVDAFTAHVKTLNAVQITIETGALNDDLDKTQARIDKLKATAIASNVRPGSALDPLADQLAAEEKHASDVRDKLAVLGGATENITKATNDAAKATENFNNAVSTLIVLSGHNITFDKNGGLHGSLTDLQDLADSLQKQLRESVTLGPVVTGPIDQALQQVNEAVIAVQNHANHLPDKLSPFMTELERQVTAIVGEAHSLGDGLDQIANIKVDASVLAKLTELNQIVKHNADSLSLDAQKARELQTALKSLTIAQLATNTDKSGSFRLDITGVITKVTADRSISAQNTFIDLLSTGVNKIKDDAEQAATATDALNAAFATGNVQAIRIAQAASDTYYAKLKKDQAAFDAQLASSGRSRGEIQHAQALAQSAVSGAGANVQLSTKLTATLQDTKDFMDGLQAMIDSLPGLVVSEKLTLDLKSVHDAALAASKEIQAAQLQALAGNTGGATAATTKTIDDFAKRIQALAQSNATGTLDQQSLAFRQIAKDASDAGISIDQVLKALQAMTALGKLSQIANTFASLASELTGANSALTQFAGGFAKAITGAVALSAAIKEIKAENLSALSNAGNASVSGLGSLAGALSFASAAGSIISGISSIVTLIGGLFGESALDKEHDAILKSNTDALATLKDTLDRNSGTAARAGDLAKAVAQTQTPDFAKILAGFVPGGGVDISGKPAIDAFTKILASFGLTLDQAEAAAKAFNITLVDSKGRLVGLSAFMDALALDAKILTTLGTDFSTQQAIIAAQNAVNGTATTAAGTLADSLTAVEKTLRANATGTSAIADTLAAASGQGSAALRKALQDLVAEIIAGKVSLADLGGFTDVASLLQALTGTADNLNALAGAANSVTDALLNVPAGFKKALAEFNAQLPQTGPTVPTAPAAPPAAPPILTPAPPPPNINPKPPDQTTPLLLDAVNQLKVIISGKASGQPAAIGGPLLPVTIPGKSVSLSLIDPQDIPPLLIDGSLLTIAAASSVVIPAPVFHVEQSAPVQLAAPSLSVQPLAPVSLAAPSVSLTSGLADIKLASPVVAVRPFAPVTLAAPQISVGDVQPVTIRAPRVTVGSAAAIKIPAPSFVVPDSTQTLTVQAPAVRVSGPLASVVLSPPPVAIGPYSASVPISPPAVKVGALAPVALRAPSVTIPDPSPVAVAAPVVRVQALASVHLPRPDVIVEPLKPVALDAPKVTVSPLADLTLKSPSTLNAPSFNLPQLQAPSDRPLMSDVQLTKALTSLASQAANAPLDGSTGDVHLHDPVFYIDAKSKTAKQMFDDVKQQAQKLAHQKTGDSTRVVDAFAQ